MSYLAYRNVSPKREESSPPPLNMNSQITVNNNLQRRLVHQENEMHSMRRTIQDLRREVHTSRQQATNSVNMASSYKGQALENKKELKKAVDGFGVELSRLQSQFGRELSQIKAEVSLGKTELAKIKARLAIKEEELKKLKRDFTSPVRGRVMTVDGPNQIEEGEVAEDNTNDVSSSPLKRMLNFESARASSIALAEADRYKMLRLSEQVSNLEKNITKQSDKHLVDRAVLTSKLDAYSTIVRKLESRQPYDLKTAQIEKQLQV